MFFRQKTNIKNMIKSVPVREQGRTMQRVIQLISPISPKLSMNVGYGELFTVAKHQLKIFYSLQVMAPFAKMAIFSLIYAYLIS